jgi:tRNA (adenine37-N6)-methyltransferase
LNSATIESIGVIESPYKEKFGIPRQPGLVVEVQSKLVLRGPWAKPEAVVGLESYSHLWVIFRFHQCIDQGWRLSVRPPRLGGNQKMGMFATRTMFRPNNLGLSLAKLDGVVCEKDRVILTLSGLDLVDGTPVFDVKPYLPYVEAVVEAKAGPFQEAPEAAVEIFFAESVNQFLTAKLTNHPKLREIIISILQQDPRPAYQRELGREYGMVLYELNIRWRVEERGFEVISISSQADSVIENEVI